MTKIATASEELLDLEAWDRLEPIDTKRLERVDGRYQELPRDTGAQVFTPEPFKINFDWDDLTWRTAPAGPCSPPGPLSPSGSPRRSMIRVCNRT